MPSCGCNLIPPATSAATACPRVAMGAATACRPPPLQPPRGAVRVGRNPALQLPRGAATACCPPPQPLRGAAGVIRGLMLQPDATDLHGSRPTRSSSSTTNSSSSSSSGGCSMTWLADSRGDAGCSRALHAAAAAAATAAARVPGTGHEGMWAGGGAAGCVCALLVATAATATWGIKPGAQPGSPGQDAQPCPDPRPGAPLPDASDPGPGSPPAPPLQQPCPSVTGGCATGNDPDPDPCSTPWTATRQAATAATAAAPISELLLLLLLLLPPLGLLLLLVASVVKLLLLQPPTGRRHPWPSIMRPRSACSACFPRWYRSRTAAKSRKLKSGHRQGTKASCAWEACAVQRSIARPR